MTIRPLDRNPWDKPCSADERCPEPAAGTVRWKEIRGAGNVIVDTPCWRHLQRLRAAKREVKIISESEDLR